MKTLREMMDQIDEINRRDLLKGAGAAALAGATGSASADRSWSKDPITDKWEGYMTSETYSGAKIFWNESRQLIMLALGEPTNGSPNNIKANRLHYPQITSPNFTAKFGDQPPFNGAGKIYTFAAKDFGNYTGYGIVLLTGGKQIDKVRDDFINADQVHVRLEIDGKPTTITFNDNPGLIQGRREQAIKSSMDIIMNAINSGKLSQQQVSTWQQQGHSIETIANYVKANIKEDQLKETSPEAMAKIDELSRK